jgi:hypothetical protein
LHQFHLTPSNHVPPLIFEYQLKHTFFLDRILFAQTLIVVPHLFSNGISKLIYEHLLGCFIPKDPSSGFLKIFQAIVTVAYGDIHRSKALVLGTSELLAMAKDTGGLCFIAIGEVFLRLINHSIIL